MVIDNLQVVVRTQHDVSLEPYNAYMSHTRKRKIRQRTPKYEYDVMTRIIFKMAVNGNRVLTSTSTTHMGQLQIIDTPLLNTMYCPGVPNFPLTLKKNHRTGSDVIYQLTGEHWTSTKLCAESIAQTKSDRMLHPGHKPVTSQTCKDTGPVKSCRILLVGSVGTGKSALCNSMLQQWTDTSDQLPTEDPRVARQSITPTVQVVVEVFGERTKELQGQMERLKAALLSFLGKSNCAEITQKETETVIINTGSFGKETGNYINQSRNGGRFGDMKDTLQQTDKKQRSDAVEHSAQANGEKLQNTKESLSQSDRNQRSDTGEHGAQSNGERHEDPKEIFSKTDKNKRSDAGEHIAQANGEKAEDPKEILSQTDKNKRNAAHRAAVNGDVIVLKYLLENVGLPADAKSSNNLTLLHLATIFGKETVVLYLCQTHASLIHQRDAIDRTALHIAAQKNRLDIVQTLVGHGADVYTQAGDGCTVLHIAASNEDPSLLRYICEHFFFNHLNVANNKGIFPIHYAARCSVENVRMLIEKGEVPSVRFEPRTSLLTSSSSLPPSSSSSSTTTTAPPPPPPPSSSGTTIAHLAAFHGKLDVLKYITTTDEGLLEITDDFGMSPAHTAAQNGHLECLKYIMGFKSVPLVSSTNGWTVAMMAARYGQIEVLKFLCENHRPLAQQKDASRWTTGHHASFMGQTGCLEYLCQSNVINPYSRDEGGQTILHAAAMNGKDATIEWIVNRFPDMVRLKDKRGKTALDLTRTNLKTV